MKSEVFRIMVLEGILHLVSLTTLIAIKLTIPPKSSIISGKEQEIDRQHSMIVQRLNLVAAQVAPWTRAVSGTLAQSKSAFIKKGEKTNEPSKS